MPQMAPINWLTLFIYFTSVMFLFSVMNYFIVYYAPPVSKSMFYSTNSLTWKW
uniref:ATP synthase complex subunit 8 n=1 Tax=Osmylus fulvicephalus TaxID=446453 RepID=A0A7G7WS67_9NEOP|nr:ATP synthase F0 subunit 8 [Osmylus fulvicephalus]QNH69893.1 ATP synthase F0 subunit 8 [Osmylus fulvicephalus]